MDYIANVENSEIDVSGIRTVLVQGDSSYPIIRFVLDPSLTGLSWRVRGTYAGTTIAVLSPEITAVESGTEITLDWSVSSDFTTYDGDMQLVLVGSNSTGTTVVKALAEITVQKDWSISTTGTITLNLFEQLMAQLSSTALKLDQTTPQTITGGVPKLASTRVIDENNEMVDKKFVDDSISTHNTDAGAHAVLFGAVDTQINRLSTKLYTNIEINRGVVATFLEKWKKKENIKIVTNGDSLTNFQNSEKLIVAEQQTSPIGLSGNNWSRKLWKMLNYDVFTVSKLEEASPNGNMGFKRFDLPGWAISNSLHTTTAAMGAHQWATNLAGSVDAWRDNPINGYAQIITPISSYNKPLMGCIAAGSVCAVPIPANSNGCAVVFGKFRDGAVGATNVRVKITIGSSGASVIDEVWDSNEIINCYELHKDYVLTPGDTEKWVWVTNVSGGELWVWGVEYWSSNCVRVINSGCAGHTVVELENILFDNVTNQDADLLILQAPILNDMWVLPSAHISQVESYFTKLQALNIPILVLTANRTPHQSINRYNLTSGITPNVTGFLPDIVQNYKTMAHKYGFGVIDTFRKSVEEIGLGIFAADATCDGWFNGDAHLGYRGNEAYAEELRRIFLWDDFE